MSRDDPSQEAWQAFQEGRLVDAERMWSALIASASTEEQRDLYRSRYAYTLVALQRFGEARAIYRELFAKHGTHRYLHQIGMVEREAGNLEEALAVFHREVELLSKDDQLGRAANLYEQALIHHLLHRHHEALGLCEECVEIAIASADPTMLGAAHRLKGDLLAGRDPARARIAYETAIGHFEEAGDAFGVREVRARIAAG